MLTLRGEAFTSGRARFVDQHPRFPEPTAKVFVKVGFPGIERTWTAQLDTGAAFSVLEAEIAAALGLLESDGQGARVSTRLGSLTGRLVRAPLTLMADE